jgi:DNA-binding transcriptional ArsR family regulator
LYLALEAAASGLAVLPLQGKEPTTGATPNGYENASRDRSRIGAMFNRSGKRATGYGIATGAASGIVVDIDGPAGLEEAKRLGLTSGYVVKTGRPEGGGFHLYFTLEPGTEVKSRKLAPGLELKGEGAYVVGPGSLHPSGAVYRVVRDGKPSPAPPCLLEPPRDLRGQALTPREGYGTPVVLDVAGPPIPEGGRNTTLTRIAGRLHDGTRTLDTLTRDLAAINAARCVPPLEAAEVSVIAKSISGKAPCKPAGPEATPEVLEALDSVEARLWRIGWRGMGELSARDVYVALILVGRAHGTLIPAGVRVSISVRALALAAGVSKRTAHYAIKRLKAAGMIRADNYGRAGASSGALVLLASGATRASLHHSPTGRRVGASGASLRTPRLRWSGLRLDRVGDETIRSTTRAVLGKSCGAVLDALERSGGSATVAELAAALHKTRTRDLRRRTIARLEAAHVVECSGDTVALSRDWLDALDREREISGEFAAYQRDMRRFNAQREAYRRRYEQPAEPVPARPPSGTIAELERVPDPAPALVGALREYLTLNPRGAYEGPSWLAGTLWAYSRVQGKPTREAVEAALAAIECENKPIEKQTMGA